MESIHRNIHQDKKHIAFAFVCNFFFLYRTYSLFFTVHILYRTCFFIVHVSLPYMFLYRTCSLLHYFFFFSQIKLEELNMQNVQEILNF
jgi:hypothetical protein